MNKEATLEMLKQDWKENFDTPELFYENSIGLLQYAAVQKDIEFDGYFRTKWEFEADHPMTFDDEYFENEYRSELYVYLSAEVDTEIFEGLKYAYDLTHDQKLTTALLHKEIYLLKEQGVKF